jgi:hypothetical protein
MLVSASLLMVLRRLRVFGPQKRTGYGLLRIGAAALLLGLLIRCVSRKYLFIASVFPVLSVWLGAAVFVFSIAHACLRAVTRTAKRIRINQSRWIPFRGHAPVLKNLGYVSFIELLLIVCEIKTNSGRIDHEKCD